MLLMSDLVITKLCKNLITLLKAWHMGTHLILLSESYPMNTNMTGFASFSVPLALEGLKSFLEALDDLCSYSSMAKHVHVLCNKCLLCLT